MPLPARSLGFVAGLFIWGGLCGCGRAPNSNALVVNDQNGRTVAAAQRLGWLSSERETGTLPSAVALGGKTSGRVLLYLEFPELSEPRKLLRAELVLSPLGGGGAAEVELSRSDEARGELKRWSDQPRALYPRLPARLMASALPLRLDVTPIAEAHEKRGEPLRVLLRAEPGEGEGVLIATGADGGSVPTLEAYWQ